MTQARDLADLISNSQVDADEMGGASVDTASIVDGAVTDAKVASGIVGTKISYDNTVSGISANTMQEAVDYLNALSGGSSGSVASYTRDKFVATAGQTTFVPSNGYQVGYIEVYMNGVLLDISDYSASDNVNVVLSVGASAGDEIVTIALDSFAIAEILRVTQISASSPDDSIVINASGYIGLGTLTPDVNLDVEGPNDVGIRIRSLGTGADSDAFLVLDCYGADGEPHIYLRRDGVEVARMEEVSSTGEFNITTASASIDLQPAGSLVLRADAATGNVGIGTGATTPLGRLEIQDDTDISMNASANGHLVIDGLGYHFCVALDADAANLFTTSASRDIVFGVDETEVMRVGNGHTYFGGKSSSGGSDYGAMFFKSGSSSVLFIDRQASDGDVVVFRRGGTEKGSIQVTSTSTVYNTSSDYRLKEDVQPMVGASDRVMALNPVNFAWKENGLRVDGFLAHEAQEIVPEAVVGVKDGMQDEEYEVSPAVYDDDGNLVSEAIIGTRQVPKYQGIDQSKLVPLLTAALQEAITEITALKERVVALETV